MPDKRQSQRRQREKGLEQHFMSGEGDQLYSRTLETAGGTHCLSSSSRLMELRSLPAGISSMTATRFAMSSSAL